MFWLWVGIIVMGLFSFAESPQLQALLADIAPPSIRDATYAVYFTLAFGVGSLWVALYGVIIEQVRRAAGVPIVFGLMALLFVLAALATCRSTPSDEPARTLPSRLGSAEPRRRPRPERAARPAMAPGIGVAARRSRDGSSQAERPTLDAAPASIRGRRPPCQRRSA